MTTSYGQLPNWGTYRRRGTTADILFNNIELPPGILLFEDPPLHDLHRRLLIACVYPPQDAGCRESGPRLL